MKRLSFLVATVAALALSPTHAAPAIKILAGSVACTATSTSQSIAPGSSGVFTVCALNDNASPNDFICNATAKILAADATTNTAAVQVTAFAPQSPFSTSLAAPPLPATLTLTASGFANGVPTNTVQAGQSSAAYQKMSELTFSVPSTVAAGTTLNFGLDATSTIGIRNALATDCNDLDNSPSSAVVANAPFSIVVPSGPPSVTISASPTSLNDSAGQTSTITITASNSTPVTVNLTPPAASARYTTTCGTTIAVTSSATCTVSAVANTTPFDGSATATIAVVTGSGYTLGANTSTSVTINNDDLPTVNVTPTTASVNDNGSSQTVTVTLSAAAPAGGFVVPLTVTNGTPARATTTCGSTITVAAGATTATCTVTGVANTTAGDGNVTVTVAPACSGTCTNGSSSVVTIVDDDVPVISAVCTPTTLTDSAGQVATCTISSDKALSSALSVNLTPPAANSRYTTTCGATITIPAGAAGTSATCTITAVANTTLGDGNVTATLAIAAGSGYSAGGTSQSVSVNNDDLATISVSAGPASVAENSGTPIVFTFTASAASPSTTNILFTPPAASSRYSTTCVSPIVLAANATTATCSVTPSNNSAVDGNVTASVALLPSAGNYTVGTASASGTITDDEIGVSVTGTGVVEGGTVSFSITCTGPAASTATVTFGITGQDSGAVISPAQGPVTVTCGTPTTVTVTTTNDLVVGNNRAVTLTLSNPVAPAALVVASATAQVLDNDAVVAVPTLAAPALGLLSLLLAGLAAVQRRRRA